MERDQARATPTKEKFGSEEWLVLGCLVFPFLFLNLVTSGQGPFFPPEVINSGISINHPCLKVMKMSFVIGHE